MVPLAFIIAEICAFTQTNMTQASYIQKEEYNFIDNMNWQFLTSLFWQVWFGTLLATEEVHQIENLKPYPLELWQLLKVSIFQQKLNIIQGKGKTPPKLTITWY